MNCFSRLIALLVFMVAISSAAFAESAQVGCGTATDADQSGLREPCVLLVGKIQPIMDILRDELIDNYNREVISSSSKEHVKDTIDGRRIDLVILGAGFDDETRDEIAKMIESMQPELSVFMVPRVGDKNPAKLVTVVNEKAVEWKFTQVLGGMPGGPGKPKP